MTHLMHFRHSSLEHFFLRKGSPKREDERVSPLQGAGMAQASRPTDARAGSIPAGSHMICGLSLLLVLRAVFNWVSKVIAELLWFCFTTLCDWFKKLAPTSQPIRFKTKTNRDLVTRVSRAWRRLRVFALSSHWFICCFRLLWLVIVIALVLVLVLRHSIENRSI